MGKIASDNSQFINNIQGNPKSVKFIPFPTGFDPKFSGYFKLSSLIESQIQSFIHVCRVLKRGLFIGRN